MPTTDKPPSPRQRLLDAVVDHALANGVADQSLRSIASAIGTSHRMLIHHFGSKEELLVEVIRSVEARQRALLANLSQDDDVMRAGWQFWQQLCDPALDAQERLFFEVYGQALQGREWARPLLDGVVSDWVTPFAAALKALGVDPTSAQADARLALAVGRGLLLDLLATGERAAVDAAMLRFQQLLMAAARPAAAPPSGRRPRSG